MLHFVTSYMKQNKSRKQTLESAQYGLLHMSRSEIGSNGIVRIKMGWKHVKTV